MQYQCPLTGQLCFFQKHIQAYKVINGQAVQLNLCNQCAGQAFAAQPDHYEMIWVRFLQTIFQLLRIDTVLSPDEYQQALLTIKNKEQLNEFLEALAQRKRRIEGLTPCPECGTELRLLLNDARMGCPNCYKHFFEFVKAMVNRVQEGADQHVGKIPKHKDDPGISYEEWKAMNESLHTEGPKEPSIEQLKHDMDLAVKDERYEDAAKIRDMIKNRTPESGASPPIS